MKLSHIALAIGLSCAALAAPAQAGISFTLTDLGALGTSGVVYDINNAGQIVGARGAGTSLAGAIWTAGTASALPKLETTASQAYAINNSGQVVGYNGAAHPTLWTNGVPSDLGGSGVSQARDINDMGQIVGDSYGSTSGAQAVIWQGGTRTVLDTPTGTVSYARGINNDGDVVGVSGSRATLWADAGAAVTLGALTGSTGSQAYAINGNGVIVGYTDFGSARHATLWDEGGNAVDLGFFAGGTRSQATDINLSGQIVGFSNIAAGQLFTNNRAVLWQDGEMLDLNGLVDAGLGWTLYQAEGINDQGQIVGYGINAQGERRGFLLTAVPGAVPEPASWALMIGGFALAGGMMRRRAATIRFA